MTAAVSADLIASLIGKKSDDIFVTGLLQDIGVVIMYLSSPDDYLKVLEEKKDSKSNAIDLEKKDLRVRSPGNRYGSASLLGSSE